MAGDWIKMRTNLDTDPRVITIAADIDVTELHAVGLLWKVWSWADSHSLDGNALRVTDVTLDRFTCPGFAAALRKVGWLEGRDNALTFPRFAEHNGQTAKKRAGTSKRVKKHRNADGVTDVTQQALPEKRREEKSREEEEPPLPPKGGNAASPRMVKLPAVLLTPEFKLAWLEWIQHRKEIKKPLKPTQAEKQIAQFAKWGAERSVAAIEYTIMKGWQGINEPDDDAGRTGTGLARSTHGQGYGGAAARQGAISDQMRVIGEWAIRDDDDEVQSAGVRRIDSEAMSPETDSRSE